MTFLILKSATMGGGTGCGLGEKLLSSFLDQLVKQAIPVDAVVCLNGGVFLTTQDGPALDSLRALEARGAKIMSCATCLDTLGIREHLKIGEVGNMAVTAELLATASRVIDPC